MNQEERYRQVLANRFNSQGSGVQDFSGPLAPGVGRDALSESVKRGETDLQNNAVKGQAAEAAPVNAQALAAGGSKVIQAASQGDNMGALGSGLMAAGSIPSPASPYLLAAGLGVQVLGAGEENKRKEEEAQRQAYNERIKQRQQAMAQIASMGIQ